MDKERPDYLSYLLRLWRVENHETSGADRVVWRASLEDSRTGERRVFAGLEELFEFLREQTRVSADSGQAATRASGFCRWVMRTRRNRQKSRRRRR